LLYYSKPIGKGEIMRISTKARYGLRFLIELAKNQGKVVSIKEISDAQRIPKRYLEQIVSILHGAGIVRSYRGPDGGYMLAVSPEDLTMFRILDVLGDPPILIECIENSALCDYSDKCAARKVWKELRDSIASHLKKISLKDIITKE